MPFKFVFVLPCRYIKSGMSIHVLFPYMSKLDIFLLKNQMFAMSKHYLTILIMRVTSQSFDNYIRSNYVKLVVGLLNPSSSL